jgi:putative glycosyltransferase
MQGWASLIVSIWLLGGLTIFCLGVIGIYLAKIFIEVKHRPYTIIKQVFEEPESSIRDFELDSRELEQKGNVVHGVR